MKTSEFDSQKLGWWVIPEKKTCHYLISVEEKLLFGCVTKYDPEIIHLQ